MKTFLSWPRSKTTSAQSIPARFVHNPRTSAGSDSRVGEVFPAGPVLPDRLLLRRAIFRRRFARDLAYGICLAEQRSEIEMAGPKGVLDGGFGLLHHRVVGRERQLGELGFEFGFSRREAVLPKLLERLFDSLGIEPLCPTDRSPCHGRLSFHSLCNSTR